MSGLSLEVVVGGTLVGALSCYLLFGGADFGAGIWTLFARGPHGQRQRALIDHAIGPIWEANHIWLIVAVTILFTAFPAAFSAILTGLHIPLSLMLIGIVLRGTAFAIRTHDVSWPDHRSRSPVWRYLFAGSSLATPALFGVCLGAIASGSLLRHRSGHPFMDMFVASWLAVFPLMIGALATALVAHLAAVYLLVEACESDVKEQFRRRALISWCAVIGVAAAALPVSREAAPILYRGLTHSAAGLGLILLTVLFHGVTVVSLYAGRDRRARLSAAGGAVALFWGWAVAQYPFVVPPTLTLYHAAPSETLRVMTISLVLGSLCLFPLLWYLYRLFKGHVLAGAGS